MRSREEILSELTSLEATLAQLNDELAEWAKTAADLTQSLATERAKNQSAGRGLGGMLFGSKYRSAMRSGAAAANASLARQAAQKRGLINSSKAALKEKIRDTKLGITACKAELRSISGKGGSTPSTTLTALKKLKELHDLGVLNDVEFEEKRSKLLSQI